jgi:hypothetical protein
MNLKKHIRKVLIETVNESTFFRRRVDMRLMEKEFYEVLNFATDMFLKRRYAGIDFTFKDFKERVIDYLMDGYHNELSDGGSKDFPYDEVYEFLSDYFHDKIKDKYGSIFDGEDINEVLKEDAYIKVSGNKYSKLIKRLVLDYVDFDICGLSVSQLPDVKDQYLVIIITEKQLKTSYREELQDYLNGIIPLTIYISIADGMDCRNYRDGSHSTKLSESKIPNQVLRRHDYIDEMFTHIRSRYNFCNHRNPAYLVNNLYEKTLEDLYHAWFYNILTDDEWDVASEYIGRYLKEKYQDETIDQWWKECGERKLNESNNKLQKELKQVIKDSNIFDAVDMVGGLTNFKKIFKDDPEMSSLFDKLTGRIIFDYYVDKEHIEFPLNYEIIGRRSNVHNTNHWPEINVLYDENKLTPEENDTFKSMIKNLADDAQHSGFKSKFDDGRIFNANYLTVVELNGENIDSIWGGHYPWIYEVEEIYDKLYGRTETLNESDNRETDKNLRAINVLLSLVSWDGLCDIWAEYNPDDKEYDIRSKTATSNDLGPSIFGIQEELQSLEESIRSMGIRVYIYTPWYVDNCEDEVKFMNESLNKSSIKEKSLIKLIEKDGLYDIIEMTGLDFNQIKSLLKQIDNPKEILKQYIREFVLEHGGSTSEAIGSLFALKLPLSNTKYVNDILVQDSDQIAVEIWGYEEDEYGYTEQTEQYLTSINNLTNDELLSIISWMMETIREGYWD